MATAEAAQACLPLSRRPPTRRARAHTHTHSLCLAVNDTSSPGHTPTMPPRYTAAHTENHVLISVPRLGHYMLRAGAVWHGQWPRGCWRSRRAGACTPASALWPCRGGVWVCAGWGPREGNRREGKKGGGLSALRLITPWQRQPIRRQPITATPRAGSAGLALACSEPSVMSLLLSHDDRPSHRCLPSLWLRIALPRASGRLTARRAPSQSPAQHGITLRLFSLFCFFAHGIFCAVPAVCVPPTLSLRPAPQHTTI